LLYLLRLPQMPACMTGQDGETHAEAHPQNRQTGVPHAASGQIQSVAPAQRIPHLFVDCYELDQHIGDVQMRRWHVGAPGLARNFGGGSMLRIAHRPKRLYSKGPSPKKHFFRPRRIDLWMDVRYSRADMLM
jgi:hypothetical protein